MKTILCLVIFVASAICAPSELLTEDNVEKKIDIGKIESSSLPVVVKQELKILPVYETKLVHSSHPLKTCSPHCHLEIFEKPLYLVMKSEALPEPQVIYLKDGLKSFQPNDKLKLMPVAGHSMVVFTKHDFPIKPFPRVIDSKTTDSEIMKADIPYVVMTDQKDFLEINRDEKYEKVAEMEVSSDGLIKGLKMIKPSIKIDDKIETEMKARTIGTTYKLIPVDENLPLSSYYDTLKMMNIDKNLPRVDAMTQIPLKDVMLDKFIPHSVYPKINPLETQVNLDNNNILKDYFLQVMRSDMQPSKSDPELALDNSYILDKVPIMEPVSKHSLLPFTARPTNMNFFPEEIQKNLNYYEHDRDMFNILRNRESYRMDYFPKESTTKYNVGNIPNYKRVLSVDVSPTYQEYPKDLENKYAPKYISVSSLNSQMGSADYNMKPNYNPYEMYQMSKPHHYYGSSPMYAPEKVPYYYPMYNHNSYPMPPKYNRPYFNPGILYILNLCQEHKPLGGPVKPVSVDNEKLPVPVETHPVEEHKKPASVVVTVTKPTEKPIPLTVSDSESPASVIHKDYEPDLSFRTVMNSPDFEESDALRKIFIILKPYGDSRPKPESHPSHDKHPSFSPPELPPIHDLRRPPNKSIPIEFFARK